MESIEIRNQAGVDDATQRLWLDPQEGLVAQMRRHMQACAAHPARVLVLVPFAHLIPITRSMWARAAGDGFAPRVETTLTWASSLGQPEPEAHSIRLDPARDSLTALSLLDAAGLSAYRTQLGPRLTQDALALAASVSAMAPRLRGAWGQAARTALCTDLSDSALSLESAVALVALEWALASTYATDVLFDQTQIAGHDAVVVLHGLQPDALTRTLVDSMGSRAVVLQLAVAAQGAHGQVGVHTCQNPDDEAQRAAACVVRHIQSGRIPVALPATDRVLTRRIRAMLETQGVAVRDETGWKLSTTRSASRLLALLRACRWDASSDDVLDWLKNAPAWAAEPVDLLESFLRRLALVRWRSLEQREPVDLAALPGALTLSQVQAVHALVQRVARQRQRLRAARPLAQWVSALVEVMHDCGLWEEMLSDAAGRQLLDVLRLHPHSLPELAGMALAERRMDLAEFTHWIDQVLEATSFVPQAPPVAEVVILPLSQMLGRPFAALVLTGCDEQTLPGSALPPGEWTARQRQQLGMPSREQLAQAQRSAWDQALTVAHVDLLRRSQDSAGETLLASPLLQRWILQGAVLPAQDPQDYRSLELRQVQRPMPQGDWLPVHRISASAYADLRSCPYRFFAQRQLGLKEIDEIESELDKRDFGLWLHAVLKQFHDQVREQGVSDPAGRRQLIDACAQAVRVSMVLDEAQFLPFMASWPNLRDGYLRWLEEHQASLQASYNDGERPCQTPVGDLTLVGKIDRIDTLPDGTILLIDYKTESRQTTQNRVAEPLEDTQLPFYAALLPDDTLRAQYLNLAEREGSKGYEMDDVVQARDALLQGLISDFARLNEGARMAALGEGSVCEYCVARGLCRKDSWA